MTDAEIETTLRSMLKRREDALTEAHAAYERMETLVTALIEGRGPTVTRDLLLNIRLDYEDMLMAFCRVARTYGGGKRGRPARVLLEVPI